MQSTDVSKSARMVALLRALHQRLPADVRIHQDAFAASLIAGPAGRRIMNSSLLSRGLEFLRPGAAAQIAARDHFADNWARRTLANVGQVLLMGAGFDSMTLRLGASFPTVKFFEIDLPGTQNAKIALLTAQGLLPRQCRFLSADFTDTSSLAVQLTDAGFDRTLPTFANWMGVSYYLPLPAVERMLATFDELLSPGSVVALDYVETSTMRNRSIWRSFLRRGGETFQTSFTQDGLKSLAAAHHFEVAEFSSTTAIAGHFFEKRRPPRQPFSFAALRKVPV